MVTLRNLNKRELVGLLVAFGRDELFISIKRPSHEWLVTQVRKEKREKNLTNKDIEEMLSDLPKLKLEWSRKRS